MIQLAQVFDKNPLFTNPETAELNRHYKPTLPRGPPISEYWDDKEMQRVQPFVTLALIVQEFCGIDRATINYFIHRTGGLYPLREGEAPQDVRVEYFDGRQIFFPTETLLDKLHVRRQD